MPPRLLSYRPSVPENVAVRDRLLVPQVSFFPLAWRDRKAELTAVLNGLRLARKAGPCILELDQRVPSFFKAH